MAKQKYLRSKTNGLIWEWNEIMAEAGKCDELTEEEAYPERFRPAHAEFAERRETRKRLKLKTEELPPEEEKTTDALESVSKERGFGVSPIPGLNSPPSGLKAS